MPEQVKSDFAAQVEAAERSRHRHSAAEIDAQVYGRALGDRDQFMEDIGKGWIVDPSWTPESGEREWLSRLRARVAEGQEWPEGVAPEPGLQLPADSLSTSRRATDLLQRGASGDPGPVESDLEYILGADKYDIGKYMGGDLGVPVYLDRGEVGSSYYFGDPSGESLTGIAGAFAPYGKAIHSTPSTGALGHELGHAKQRLFHEPYAGGGRKPGEFYQRTDIPSWDAGKMLSQRDGNQAASEAVAGYLGRRIIRTKPAWGAAAEDKSWAAYEGLPSYLAGLDEAGVKHFLLQLGEYDKQYPGLEGEVLRAIREYDTLIAPKRLNDTSRGDWSEEGLKFMKEWRKSKGLKEVPEGNLYERAHEAGPYSMRQGLRGDEVGRAVSSLGQDGGGIASPEMMSRYRPGGAA